MTWFPFDAQSGGAPAIDGAGGAAYVGKLYVNVGVVDKVKLDGAEVKKIREELHLSQEEFVRVYKIPKGTLLMWEWGRRRPSEASSVYLRLIQSEPKRIASMLEKLCRPPRQRRRLLEDAA